MFHFFVFFIFFTISAFAAPLLLNYQGTLLDDAGNPVTSAKEMSFKIYDVPAGGTAFWDSGKLQVPVFNGVFSVPLDGEGPDNPFPANLFSKDKLYIGVTVFEGDTPKELTERKRNCFVEFR